MKRTEYAVTVTIEGAAATATTKATASEVIRPARKCYAHNSALRAGQDVLRDTRSGTWERLSGARDAAAGTAVITYRNETTGRIAAIYIARQDTPAKEETTA